MNIRKKTLAFMLITVMAITIMPINALAGEVKDPTDGKVYKSGADVKIEVLTDEYKEAEGNENYCEILVYSVPQNGLKVLEQIFPYTEKGQTVSTTFSSTVSGDYYVYTSCYYLVNGFKNYHEGRKMYNLKGQTIWASGVSKFTIGGSGNGISVSKTKVSFGKKTTVNVISSGGKVTIAAKNKLAKTKKYVKITSGSKGKLVFSKSAKKGKYKFKATAKIGGKTVSKSFSITVK